MRKSLLLFLLLPALIFTSCSKNVDDEPEPQETSTQVKLKGTWKELSSKREYFDEAGAKVHEDEAPLSTITLNGSSTYIAKYYSEIVNGSYSLSKNNSGEYLSFTVDNGYYEFKLNFVDSSNLTLTLETLNDVYFIDSVQKTAAKSVFTSTLVKQ